MFHRLFLHLANRPVCSRDTLKGVSSRLPSKFEREKTQWSNYCTDSAGATSDLALAFGDHKPRIAPVNRWQTWC